MKNFLSFDDEVQFDMFPNLKRTQLGSHIYTNIGGIPILKQAAIYGANGAGKSNLVKAIEFIRAFALDKDFAKRREISKLCYLLKENTDKKPISLSIEFEYQNRFFFYEIGITENKVERECLNETFPHEGKMDMIYERYGYLVNFGKEVKVEESIVEATKNLLSKNPLASLLALNDEFPIVPDSRCKFATKWFEDQLEIIGIHSYMPTLIDMFRENNAMLEFASRLVDKLDVGVSRMKLQESDFDQWAKSHVDDKIHNENNTPVFSINIKNGVKKAYQLIFENIGKNGFVGSLDTSSQSDGTLRALTLLLVLYYACKMGKTMVVDGISFCLSHTMVKGIVEFFAKTEDTNGQLIFTTHDNQLLDERDILRSDEIWFVDKQQGASLLYSHNDFKEHHTISPMRGYNEGRYGAIRFVNLLEQKS